MHYSALNNAGNVADWDKNGQQKKLMVCIEDKRGLFQFV